MIPASQAVAFTDPSVSPMKLPAKPGKLDAGTSSFGEFAEHFHQCPENCGSVTSYPMQLPIPPSETLHQVSNSERRTALAATARTGAR